LPQLCHLLLGACNPFLELANALHGPSPDGIVRGSLLALRSGGARRDVSAGAGEHLLDRHVQGACHASERVTLGVGQTPFSLDAATAFAEDLEPHPRDTSTFGQLPDGQSRVLPPLLDPLAEGLPGCLIQRYDSTAATVVMMHVRKLRAEGNRRTSGHRVCARLREVHLALAVGTPELGTRTVDYAAVRNEPLTVETSIPDPDRRWTRHGFFPKRLVAVMEPLALGETGVDRSIARFLEC
jgi:hypothetical protein